MTNDIPASNDDELKTSNTFSSSSHFKQKLPNTKTINLNYQLQYVSTSTAPSTANYLLAPQFEDQISTGSMDFFSTSQATEVQREKKVEQLISTEPTNTKNGRVFDKGKLRTEYKRDFLQKRNDEDEGLFKGAFRMMGMDANLMSMLFANMVLFAIKLVCSSDKPMLNIRKFTPA